ncbi:MAG: lauroyl acyltransferase [Cohaesibacter sp.]|nr:lauroyl acyltransferase [Cohaesibacter sp.]MCV6600477.1 lauroyl acyltransferase [Cohaesibacter sp.]
MFNRSSKRETVTLSHRLEYAGVLLVVAILRAMSLAMASSFMGWCWRKIAPRLSRQKRAMTHLRQAFPEKNDEELHAITLDMWDNLGRTFAESLLVDRFEKAAENFHKDANFDAFYETITAKGCVLVSLHSGNWELGGIVAHQHGVRLATVYQKLKNPLVNAYVIEQRTAFFKGGIHAKGNRAGAKLMAWVREGNIAAIMGDLRDRGGLPVEFFGRPAPTNAFPARVARNLNVPLVAGRFVRREGLEFDLVFEEIDVPRTQDSDADVKIATERVQAVFEKWIRARPDQWMWAHKRWD